MTYLSNLPSNSFESLFNFLLGFRANPFLIHPKIITSCRNLFGNLSNLSKPQMGKVSIYISSLSNIKRGKTIFISLGRNHPIIPPLILLLPPAQPAQQGQLASSLLRPIRGPRPSSRCSSLGLPLHPAAHRANLQPGSSPGALARSPTGRSSQTGPAREPEA
jgi:hypothetical protein